MTARDPAGFAHGAGQALRQVWLWVAWGVRAALVGAGLCWSCGCDARTAWARVGPPGRVPPPDPVRSEACRGVRELERYLAGAAPRRAR